MLVSTARDYAEALGLKLDVNFLAPHGINGSDRDAGNPSDAQPDLPFGDGFKTARDESFVLSIKPNYSEEILKGAKTVELRRRFRRSVSPTATALIYTTAPTMAITGVVRIVSVECTSIDDLWATYSKNARIERPAFDDYFSGREAGYALQLASAQRLRRPLPLNELRMAMSFDPPQSYMLASPLLRGIVDAELT